jgi:thioredoxin-like negative regulator of GroEL
MEAGDTEGVAAALEQAHALAPDDADLTLALADAYDRARWYGAAAAAYAEAGATAPDRADVAMAQARFHLARSFRVRLALAPAERAARLLPGDPEAILLLDRARTTAGMSEGN